MDMDYDIHISTINGQKESFNGLKSQADELKSACDSLPISGDMADLKTSVVGVADRIVNGYSNYKNWLDGYMSELETTEGNIGKFEAPELKGDFSNIFTKVLVPALKSGASKEDKAVLKSLGMLSSGYEGEKYFQFQRNKYNCGMTAFLMAVNMMIGKNKYTDNVGEWEKVGGNTTTIGWDNDTIAQNWINNNGLSDQIKVTGIECIHSKEDLYNHLDKGEVVVASSSGQVFKRKDGSLVSADHYICFYKNEDGVCYANDSRWDSDDADNHTAIPYTPEDLDRFYSMGAHGSVTLAKV